MSAPDRLWLYHAPPGTPSDGPAVAYEPPTADHPLLKASADPDRPWVPWTVTGPYVLEADKAERLRGFVEAELTHGGVFDELAQVATILGTGHADHKAMGARLDALRDRFGRAAREALDA